MTFFKSKGFDSLIGAGTEFKGDLFIAAGTTLQIDGDVQAQSISSFVPVGGASDNSTLVIQGSVESIDAKQGLIVHLDNVIVTGTLHCTELIVKTLSVKKGAIVVATRIQYETLVIQPGAKVHGLMQHGDGISPFVPAGAEA